MVAGEPTVSGNPRPDWTRYTLVGVTCEPNIPNLVAATHLGVKRYVALDTAAAAKAGWGKGLQAVLGNPARAVSCERLEVPAGDELKVATFRAFLAAALSSGPLGIGGGPVVWHLGGGTRGQQIALFETFMARARAGHADFAVYSDVRRRKTTLLEPASDLEVRESEEETWARLTIEEIAGCLGYEIGQSRPMSTPAETESYERFRADAAWRREWFGRWGAGQTQYLASKPAPMTHLWDLVGELRGSSRIQSAVKERLKNELASRPTAHKRVATAISVMRSKLDAFAWALKSGPARSKKTFADVPGLFDQMAQALEQMPDVGGEAQRENLARSLVNAAFHPKVWAEATGWKPLEPMETPIGTFLGLGGFFDALVTHRVAACLGRLGSGGVVDARTDVRFVKQGRAVAEHDMLLATREGVLTSLDAKTFDLASEEFQSRLLKLRAHASPFLTVLPVFPFFPEEMDSDGTPERLRTMVFELSAVKQAFAVVGAGDAPFWVRRDPADGRRIQRAGKREAGWTACETLERLVERLNRTG
ncbi:MAG: hypothetical protein HY303_21985 [Candidatus Wallbacteria bacterium]|nr:hypothetical protein [Candidatus Wallbacteria bacterium]